MLQVEAASRSQGPYFQPAAHHTEYAESEASRASFINQNKRRGAPANPNPTSMQSDLNMSSITHQSDSRNETQSEANPLESQRSKQVASFGIKGTLVSNGRCPTCTLKPPCKHYLSCEDLPQTVEKSKGRPPLPITAAQQRQSDIAFQNLMSAGNDPITSNLVASFLKSSAPPLQPQ
jgi:hypothetical protein